MRVRCCPLKENQRENVVVKMKREPNNSRIEPKYVAHNRCTVLGQVCAYLSTYETLRSRISPRSND